MGPSWEPEANEDLREWLSQQHLREFQWVSCPEMSFEKIRISPHEEIRKGTQRDFGGVTI